MSNSIIQVTNLSKSYTISHEGRERYTALRDVMAQKAKKIFSFPKSLRPDFASTTKEEFWALKDINFEIEQGDRVGIIGRNGAGKSTLLKILSRITEPTSGEIKIKGRVASLLEVGTGFHPELTGRENIFLNGAILGMSRVEIKKHFDAIVDFAEVEKFLDTPVKRYSSGMYVRLAFAVAAHLEPEILVVDEVLAVGDAEFQKKCLGKMEDVSKNEGRTVLFVSHNMGVVNQLCHKAILLRSGKILSEGLTHTVIDDYITHAQKGDSEYQVKNIIAATKQNHFINIYSANNAGRKSSNYNFDENVNIHFSFQLKDKSANLQIGIGLNDKFQNRIFTVLKALDYFQITGSDIYCGSVEIPAKLIAPNYYTFAMALWSKDGQVSDYVDSVCPITIHDTGTELALYEGGDNGYIIINPIWKNG